MALNIQEVVEELTGQRPSLLNLSKPAAKLELGNIANVIDVADVPGVPGGINLNELPKGIGELPFAINSAYDLTASMAGDLNIPVAGGVSGGLSRRVVILERSAYAIFHGNDGSEYHYGYALRLCVTVNKWDANMKISLPFLAASAQMGQLEASWMLQVIGLAGPEIDKAIAPPQELNVETFVLAKQSLTALIGAINHGSTKFRPVQVAKIESAAQMDRGYRAGSAKTFALSRIARKTSQNDCLNRIHSSDPVILDSIRDTYVSIVGANPADRPSDDMARKARSLLSGIEADV